MIGVAGLVLLWTMWRAGGDFWPMQRPFIAVTLVSTAAMVAAATLAAALPRGAVRLAMIALTVFAMLATFFGEDFAERGRFDSLRAALSQEVEAIAEGADCTTPCRIDSRTPLRIAFLLNGEGAHWSGACYDASDKIFGVESGHAVRPPDPPQAAMLKEASGMFSGQVRHAPAWGDHWYGCSTRP